MPGLWTRPPLDSRRILIFARLSKPPHSRPMSRKRPSTDMSRNSTPDVPFPSSPALNKRTRAGDYGVRREATMPSIVPMCVPCPGKRGWDFFCPHDRRPACAGWVGLARAPALPGLLQGGRVLRVGRTGEATGKTRPNGPIAVRPASPPLRLSTSPPPPSPPTTPNTQKHPLPHPILGPECLSRPQKMVLTTETGPLGTGTSQLGMAHRPLPMTYHAPPPSPSVLMH
ncbi:hypothetical protein BGZ61DRAFT_470357 [Ilyonectria robusta]|uniref:uncharacterized protein n=1 Tax=Ilyonectria robusta TaxID=1079257 RepID=UPI001E8E6DB3|nr:uncharacterized protein BGZ61DRAFT_470357 [Ilyonectria robusta]KAH8736847.1 hypothetical protein BGZ61DRAFT_470357 [Ilyonectria robusta]